MSKQESTVSITLPNGKIETVKLDEFRKVLAMADAHMDMLYRKEGALPHLESSARGIIYRLRVADSRLI